MTNQLWQRTTLEDGPHEWRRAWHLGWVDGQHRARWHPEYDEMTRSQQIAYESGRLCVVNVAASGLAVPRWTGSRSGAREVGRRIGEAAQLVGGAIPPEFRDGAPPP